MARRSAAALVDRTLRPVAGVAPDALDQMGQIDEFVRLAAQFVATIGGCVAIVETTDTRTPLR